MPLFTPDHRTRAVDMFNGADDGRVAVPNPQSPRSEYGCGVSAKRCSRCQAPSRTVKPGPIAAVDSARTVPPMTHQTTAATPDALHKAITHLEKVDTKELEEILRGIVAGQRPVKPLVTPPLSRLGAHANS